MAVAVLEAPVLVFLWMGTLPADTPTWCPAELFPATNAYPRPDFELEDITGESLRLSDFDGQIVSLNDL